jgi:hypothetical protein
MQTVTLTIPADAANGCAQRLEAYNRGLPPNEQPRTLEGMLQDLINEDVAKWQAAYETTRLNELRALGVRIIAQPAEVQDAILTSVRALLPAEEGGAA